MGGQQVILVIGALLFGDACLGYRRTAGRADSKHPLGVRLCHLERDGGGALLAQLANREFVARGNEGFLQAISLTIRCKTRALPARRQHRGPPRRRGQL